MAWASLGVYLIVDRIDEGRIPPITGTLGIIALEVALLRWTRTANRRRKRARV
ncbi:hypothetical protein [Streptomyces phaeoluteigriseus]|uniref:hypothetical protein n=1 Tax=Streptomyces phaeoluteigriseus TaxID=114686 RepID=UPI001301B75C|nr:hypothetical protein [Streptomyces phaeoluteigriseus]